MELGQKTIARRRTVEMPSFNKTECIAIIALFQAAEDIGEKTGIETLLQVSHHKKILIGKDVKKKRTPKLMAFAMQFSNFCLSYLYTMIEFDDLQSWTKHERQQRLKRIYGYVQGDQSRAGVKSFQFFFIMFPWGLRKAEHNQWKCCKKNLQPKWNSYLAMTRLHGETKHTHWKENVKKNPRNIKISSWTFNCPVS